jgi:hypothetical protein
VNPNDYLPGNPAGIDPSEYNTAYNLGRIYGTTDNSRGGATRGGWFNYGESAGIFHLNLGHTPADWFNYNGFRCVCNMD